MNWVNDIASTDDKLEQVLGFKVDVGVPEAIASIPMIDNRSPIMQRPKDFFLHRGNIAHNYRSSGGKT
jgi:hypothetical protein